MTAIRLVGAVAVSTISLVALMWFLRRKKPLKKKSENLNKSENAISDKNETKNNLRHISSQPLITESNNDSTPKVPEATESKNSKQIEQEINRHEDVIVQEVAELKSSEFDSLLKDSSCFEANSEGTQKSKKSDNVNKNDLSGKHSLQQDDLIVPEVINNLNKSTTAKVNKQDCENDKTYQNFNLTNDVSEAIESESVSVLNEAMTASRFEEISFVNKLESECRIESESTDKNDQETICEQDVLSVSTMVPLLESTNLDITCSQSRESNTDDVLKAETSIKLESSINESAKSTSSKDNIELSHLACKNSVVDSNSCCRSRNDSNCSSQSASHLDDKFSETSSERTSSPIKDRNSVSPSKDLQQGIVENGVSSSDTSNCDSASVESDKGSISQKKISYRCNFPTELCGRLIGKFGKNINFIKEKTGANVALNTNPYTASYQLCTIDGTQTQIDDALAMICKKFPDVDLRQVDIPSLSDPRPANPMIIPEIMQVIPGISQLNLPEGVSVDVVVSSIMDAGHVFMQQPTHPSFPSLERLNQFMNACYTQDGIVPQLPRPLEVGVICSAPLMDNWYRAQVTAVFDGPDECDIKYVDYGGFSRVPGSVLRQIRSDFMTLPFQGIECYMANVTPLQDEEYFSSEAAAVLEELTQGKLLQAQVVGRNEDGIGYCHIYQINGDKVTFVNRELVNRGVVRWIEILS